MPLRIGRHAVQAMLHEALACAPNLCGGLLAGEGRNVITAASLPNCASDPARHYACHAAAVTRVMEAWRRQGLKAIGAYRSYTVHIAPEKGDFSVIQEAAAQAAGGPFPLPWYLAIALDTAGRLEMHAYNASGRGLVESACELVEDGTVHP